VEGNVAKVFLFGAGASCEYRGAYGTLFMDSTFFPAIREAWETWLRGGEPLTARAWIPRRARVVPTGPHHYDGERWRWPDLDALLKRVCGPGYEALGLETTFSAVAEREVDAERDQYLRGIELALFHKLRTTDAVALDVHVPFLRQHLAPGDVVLTFNYDPLLEIALGALTLDGRVYWHPRDGYRIALLDPDGGQEPPDRPSNVELLKLHGSMNWLAPVNSPSRPPFRLLRVTPDSFFRGPGQLIHSDERGMLRPVIVPPRPAKDYEALGLTALWTRTEEALASASALTVVGYRLPPTDDAALGLLTRTAGRLAAGTPITYVTRGDEDAIRRFRDAFPTADVHRGGFRAYVDATARA